jgi:hypothetical protein
MPEVGLEPTRPCGQRILSAANIYVVPQSSRDHAYFSGTARYARWPKINSGAIFLTVCLTVAADAGLLVG